MANNIIPDASLITVVAILALIILEIIKWVREKDKEDKKSVSNGNSNGTKQPIDCASEHQQVLGELKALNVKIDNAIATLNGRAQTFRDLFDLIRKLENDILNWDGKERRKGDN